MIRRSQLSKAATFVWIFCLAWKAGAIAAPTVIGVVENFDSAPLGVYQKGYLDTHRWSEEFRQRARAWSSVEVVSEGAGRAVRVRVSDAQVFTNNSGAFLRLNPFFPPEADAIRVRIKVLSEQVSIYAGGPTAYYANSDVFTEAQTLRASDPPGWVEVTLSFNHPTWRNYRRAGFSTDAPRNYYSRWAQEPMGLHLAPDSLGEFLIDHVELVALGEGKPFAVFQPEQVKEARSIADFEDGKRESAFTLYMAAAEAEWFEESWKRTKPLRFEPMELSVVDGASGGGKLLQCRGRTAEEVHCVGVRTSGSAEANAIAVTVAVDAPEQRNTLVGAGTVVPLDFLVFTAPAGTPLPWSSFEASAELKAQGGPGFDYQFTHRLLATAHPEVSFAIYQTRRYLKPGEWTQLVLPAADFTCVYGQGSLRTRLLQHEPLHASEIVAVAWLNPWCRAGRRDDPVVTRVDRLSFVQVPGTPEEHRSFWQVPDVKLLQHRVEESAGLRRRHVWLPGDAVQR